MTRIFGDDGSVVPVSVIEATPNTVARLRTPERDGYAALQLVAGTAKKVSSPVAGQFKHLDKDAAKPRNVSEFRVESTDGYEAGQTVDVSLFEAGELVDVIGTSKCKGFAGTIARHNFQRGPKTHGSTNYRQPGSIGAGTTIFARIPSKGLISPRLARRNVSQTIRSNGAFARLLNLLLKHSGQGPAYISAVAIIFCLGSKMWTVAA